MNQENPAFYEYPLDESGAHFHSVICLNEQREGWEEAKANCPTLCKGWFELALLSRQDRIEFCKGFWQSKMPYHPDFLGFSEKFFAEIEDILIYLVQRTFDDIVEPHMVYKLKSGKGYFRGFYPASDTEVVELQQNFPQVIFPRDYISFLQIHNGFCKVTDTGILISTEVKSSYANLQSVISSHEGVLKQGGKVVDPEELIPFYESFGMPFYQCFWSQWYPEGEMGNVYYSGVANTISDIAEKGASAENMAFPTFTDWLMFYLETIEV